MLVAGLVDEPGERGRPFVVAGATIAAAAVLRAPVYDAGLAVLRTEGDVPTAALGAPARRDDPEQLSSQLGTTPQARISYGQR